MQASQTFLPAYIDKLRNNLISRFENLVATAAIERTDYNTTSYNALHMKDETAALVSQFLGVHSTPSTLCIRHSRFRIPPQFHALCTLTSSLSLYRVFNPTNPTNHTSLSQIRAAEDLLSLTRQMQELWLFGQLDTLGKSVVEEKTEADARRVAELIQTLVRREEVKEGGEAGGQ
jgi:hypothetical protein